MNYGMNFLRRFAASFSIVGITVGGLFLATSLTPSMIPRPYIMQAILSALALLVGYGIGSGVAWLWRYLELPLPTKMVSRWLSRIALLGNLLLLGVVIWRMPVWENSLRSLMEMPSVSVGFACRILALALIIALALLMLFRFIRFCVRLFNSGFAKVLPRRIALVISVVLVSYIFAMLVSGVLAKQFVKAADATSRKLDRHITDELQQPTEAVKTGSAASLIPWQNIGRQGKRFITSGPSGADIEAFSGAVAKQPIRIYLGLDAADTPQQRAALALEEMKRVGAFERKVLVIATPTGTGWLDENAVDSLEYLHGGDTAIVANQYSYLPSWLTILLDSSVPRVSAQSLFNAVYAHWTALDKDTRPKLYLHGLSLGALGSEDSTELFLILDDLFQGAVWSGPPFPSTIWPQVRDFRHPNSQPWMPSLPDNRMFRVTGKNNEMKRHDGPWGPMRIVYIQHPSDPMSWFSTDTLFRRPDWLGADRGPDISPYFDWYPIITTMQLAFDLPIATNVPLGYGHNFAADSYIDAWLEVTEPVGWSDVKIDRLKSHLKKPRSKPPSKKP